MFYRKDVLEELGLEIPNTWQELIEMLPTIQGNNMTIAIPTAAGSSATASASTSVASNAPALSMYFSLLYQYGGDMSNEAGTRTVVNSEAGVQAFDDYVRYFNDYGTPTIYDFVSRFRSGEMPIGIASYSIYNTLMVSAPEIRGLWDFTLIPGTETTDGNGRTYIDPVSYTHLDVYKRQAQGFGIAIVPHMDMLHKLDISIIPITAPAYERNFYMVYDERTYMPPVVRDFMKYVLEKEKMHTNKQFMHN